MIVIIGEAQGIGRCIADMFAEAGVHICFIDKQVGDHIVGDIAEKTMLKSFAKKSLCNMVRWM